MSNYELIEKEPVSYIDVQKVIKKKEKEKDLTYREEKIKEYLKNFVKLSVSDYKKVKKELEDLEISRLEEKHIIKIIDLMPENGTQLRAIVSHTGTVLVDENVNKILKILQQYRK